MNEYKNLSEDELQNVIKSAEIALKAKQSEKKKEVIIKIKELASSVGVIVEINEGDGKGGNKVKKVPAKYKNPKDSKQTWTGRGVAPKWMQELIKNGHDKSEFLI